MISGKSEKIGKSKGLKRPVLNVDKILNFRQKRSGDGPGREVLMGFLGVPLVFLGVPLGKWGIG